VELELKVPVPELITLVAVTVPKLVAVIVSVTFMAVPEPVLVTLVTLVTLVKPESVLVTLGTLVPVPVPVPVLLSELALFEGMLESSACVYLSRFSRSSHPTKRAARPMTSPRCPCMAPTTSL